MTRSSVPVVAPAILVLEDEAAVALELETRLVQLGYRVLGPVATREDAVRLAASDRPALLLADVRIVGQADGIEVAVELRDRFDVPTVFVSAHSDANTMRRIVASSPFGYLTKPFREAELHGTIQTALVRARLERELAERERRLREAYRIGGLGHWELSPRLGVASVSDEVLRLLGIPGDTAPEELVARFLERVVEEDRAALSREVEQLDTRAETTCTRTFRVRQAQRGVRHMRVYCEVRAGDAEVGPKVVGVLQDVTVLEQAAAVAREREERARIAYEVSGDGEWEWHPQTNRLSFSARWRAMLGYAESEEDAVLGEWESRVHPDDLEAARRQLREHLEGRTEVYFSEHRVRGKSGEFVHIIDRGKVVEWTDDGRPARMIGIITDVTDLRRAETRAMEAQLRYRRLFDHAAVGVAELDAASGYILRANGRFVSILGRATYEVEGRRLGTFTRGCDVTRELEGLRRIAAGESVEETIEKRVLDGSGSERWVRQTLSPLEPATSTTGKLVCVLHDVTDRKRAEQEREAALRSLERTTRELEAMIAAFPDALMHLERGALVLRVRGDHASDEGAGRARLDGARPEQVFTPEGCAALRWALERALDLRVVANTELEMLSPEDPRAFEARVVPTEGDEALVILRDITEQRAADRTLRAREEQLRQAQRLEAVGRLAGGIAHDFNNLLSVVVCTAALLEPRLGADGESRALVRDIFDASERASSLTQQLLAFSRKQVVDPRPVDVNARILSFARLMERTVGPTIALVLHLCPRSATVVIDPGQLEQMLLNLVVNARDAMPAGGTLEIATSLEVRRDRPSAPPTSVVRIVVRDEGEGIEPQALDSIFEPFFTTKEVGRGTGLGLATVHGIVHQAGGQISVASTRGRGTTFDILLPLVPTKPLPAQETPVAAAPANGEHILVVDDERSVRRLTAQLLERIGYRVSEAADGLEALAMFRRAGTSFDAVVADLVMPRLGGIQLATEIRRDAPTLPILFLSGFGDDSAIVRSLGSVLIKPYTPQRLYLAVQQVMHERRSERGA